MIKLRPYTLLIKVRIFWFGSDDNYIVELTKDQLDKTIKNTDVRRITILKYIPIYINSLNT